MDYELPPTLHHGRGAVSAPAGRFERLDTSDIDDGWLEGRDEPPPQIPTRLHIDTSRSLINKVDSPDLGFMRTINPYRGCEHGCIYCYARPSHSFLGFSAGLDFETEIFHKPDAADILRKELSAKNYRVAPIMLGSNTDCYQPIERELKLTRDIISVLAETLHPFTVITKSSLVTRDIDLIAPMAAQNLARVNISLTTLDPELARVMEPRAAAPYKRLKAMEALAKAGIPVVVMAAPMIPGLNDMELEQILQSAYDAGARDAHYTLVRLPYELKDLFGEWLRTHMPDRADRVLSLIRQTRDGKLYDADFSQRMTGQGAYAELLANRFALAKKRYGLGAQHEHEGLRIDLFRPPSQDQRQMSLGF
jgi:DNA repair photolyase